MNLGTFSEGSRRIIESGAFYVLLVTFLVLDTLTTISRWGIVRIVLENDFLASLLAFTPFVFPSLSGGIVALEYMIILMICARTTRKVARKTEFFPKLRSLPMFVGVVLIQWITFLLFAVTLGSGIPFAQQLPYRIQLEIFLFLHMLPLSAIALFPYTVGMFGALSRGGSDIPTKFDVRSLNSAIVLFPAGLAITYQFDLFIEVVAIAGVIVRLFGSGWFEKFDVERSLENLITQLDNGSRGFALAILILTGLYLCAWGWDYIWFQYSMLRAVSHLDTSYSPVFFLHPVANVAQISGFVLWIRGSSSRYTGDWQKIPISKFTGLLIFQGTMIFWFQSSIRGGSLTHPAYFAIALALSVVTCVEVYHRVENGVFAYLLVIVFGIILIPEYLHSDLNAEQGVLALPVIAYGISELSQKLGQILGAPILSRAN